MTLVLTRPLAESDYGVIDMNEECRITNFREKGDARRATFINAGIYVMDDDIFPMMPQAGRFSLEYDLMPALIPYGCYGFLTDGTLIDIGTPERYSIAHDQLPHE